MLNSVVDLIRSERPKELLYHYTSLSGGIGIVESKSIYATNTSYLSDTSEVTYALGLLRERLQGFLYKKPDAKEWIDQFSRWLMHPPFTFQHQFIACFTSNGDLLSQWRGYCPPNQGVSLGFNAGRICDSAERQSFAVCKCLYDREQHENIIETVLKSIDDAASRPDAKNSEAHHTECFFNLFNERADSLADICISIKNPAFVEEAEWRLVSPRYKFPEIRENIQFRAGKTSLIPYIPFSLPITPGGCLDMRHSIIGPTSNALSHRSFQLMLAKHYVGSPDVLQPRTPSVSGSACSAYQA